MISIAQPQRMIVLVVHYLLNLILVGSINLVVEVCQAQAVAKLVYGYGLYTVACSIFIIIRIPGVMNPSF